MDLDFDKLLGLINLIMGVLRKLIDSGMLEEVF